MPARPRIITITGITIMTRKMRMEDEALYRLMTWLSPAYPVGAFCHSSGLEWAVEAGWVTNRATTLSWLETWIDHGGGWNDAVLFTHAWRAAAARSQEKLDAVAALAAVAHPSAERRLEQLSQGAAFRRIARESGGAPAVFISPDSEISYPVAVAAMAAGHGIALASALTAYLHAGAGNLVSAAQRLVPLGQTDAQLVMEALRASVMAAATRAGALDDGDPLDALGGVSLLADLASILHETQYTRLFRT
jgi:urease accessory protein